VEQWNSKRNMAQPTLASAGRVVPILSDRRSLRLLRCNSLVLSSRTHTGSVFLPHDRIQPFQRRRQIGLQVVSFKFLKQLGLKKPDFLPDFGKVPALPAAAVLMHAECA
jgi:hypothetical protein